MNREERKRKRAEHLAMQLFGMTLEEFRKAAEWAAKVTKDLPPAEYLPLNLVRRSPNKK